MLTKKEKTAHFKRNSQKNYQASLALEGYKADLENKAPAKIEDLKAKYAR